MEWLFRAVLEIGMQAGFVVLAVLVLRLLCRKAPKWLTVLLWGLVGLRLIMPFSVEWDHSLIPNVSVSQVTSEWMNNVHEWQESVPPSVGQAESDTPPVLSESEDEPIPLMPSDSPDTFTPTVSVTRVASVIWLFGMAGMLWYAAISYIGVWRRVRTATRLSGNVYESEAVSSPFVLGVFRPRIYIPYGLVDEEREAMLAHERAHIKRGDTFVKPFSFMLLAVYWFQPLLWIAYWLLCRDMEMACDEHAIRSLDHEQRQIYSRTLVASAVGRKRIAACPLAFGGVAVKERVKKVMNYKKPALWLIVTAVVLTTVTSAFLLTNRPKGSPYTTFEGATLEFYLGGWESGTMPLSDYEETPTASINSDVCGVYGFALKEADIKTMTATVTCNRELPLDGKMVKEITVPFDEEVVIYPSKEEPDIKFRLVIDMPKAAYDDRFLYDDEKKSMTLHRYVSGDVVLYLYDAHFWMTTGGSKATGLEREYNPYFQKSNTLWDMTPVEDTREIVEGKYEWSGDTLLLTEDGGLTRYVFQKSRNGETLTHLKRELRRHERAGSPVLNDRLKLTHEYAVEIEKTDIHHCRYTVISGDGKFRSEGESDPYALRLFSDGDGVVRVEREDADDDVFRLEQEVLDLKNGVGHGVCFYGTSPDSSLSTGYQPHIGEQDGKVIVNAQYVSWCGTAPDDNYLFELEGLSRVKDGNVRAIIDNYDILITYTDDEGHVRVIAQELKEDGIPMAQPLVTVSEFDAEGSAVGNCVERAPSLYYHGIADAAVWIDGKYVEVARALWENEISWTDLMMLANRAVEDGLAIRRAASADDTVTYDFTGVDMFHSIRFVTKEDASCEVHIGYFPKSEL